VSVKLYFDVHVRRAVASGLRLRGVDILTAQADGAERLSDPDLLDRAARLGRVVFTHDDTVLREAELRQADGRPFAGVVYAHQLGITVRQCVDDLEVIAESTEPEEWTNAVMKLPL